MLDPQTRWTRHKLQALLAAGVALLCALLLGGVWAIAALLSPDATPAGQDSPEPQPARDGSARDNLAEEPLPSAALEQAQPGPLSTAQVKALKIPAATTVGAAAVASGFPQTPEGALGQLVAINQATFTSASVRTAQEVIEAWAQEGGPDEQSWTGVQALAALLSSAGVPAEAQNSIGISIEPSMGFIKGTVGTDFVVPCVNYMLSAALPGAPVERVAVADCQRMQWEGPRDSGRWMIAAGKEPAAAPSLWPGTQASFDAGYLWLEVEQ